MVYVEQLILYLQVFIVVIIRDRESFRKYYNKERGLFGFQVFSFYFDIYCFYDYE